MIAATGGIQIGQRVLFMKLEVNQDCGLTSEAENYGNQAFAGSGLCAFFS